MILHRRGGLSSGYVGNDVDALDPRLRDLAMSLPGALPIDLIAQWPQDSGRDPLVIISAPSGTAGTPAAPNNTRRTRISHRGTSFAVDAVNRGDLTTYPYYFLHAGFVLNSASETGSMLMAGDIRTFAIGCGFGIGDGANDWATPGNSLMGLKFGVAWAWAGGHGGGGGSYPIGTGFHTATVLFSGITGTPYFTYFYLDGAFQNSDAGTDFFVEPSASSPAGFSLGGMDITQWPSSGVRMVYAMAGVSEQGDNRHDALVVRSGEIFSAGAGAPVLQTPKSRRRHYFVPQASSVLMGQACL